MAQTQFSPRQISTCRTFVGLHGYFSRALFHCNFETLSERFVGLTNACSRIVDQQEAQQLFAEGITTFDSQFEQTGKSLCEQVSQKFPDTFLTKAAQDLSRKEDLLLTTVKAGDYVKALALAKQLEAEVKQTLGIESREYARALNSLGIIYGKMGLEKDSAVILQRAMPLMESRYGPASLDFAKLLNNLAEAYFRLGNFQDAISLFRRALSLHEIIPDNKLSAAETAMGLGNALSETSNYSEAEQYFEKALNHAGRETLISAHIYRNLGVMAERKNDLLKAEERYTLSINIFERVGATNDTELAAALVSLGDIQFHTSRKALAEPLFRRALAIYESTLGIEHSRTAHTLDKLSRALILNALSADAKLSKDDLDRKLLEYLSFRRKASRSYVRAIESSGGTDETDRGVFSRHLAALSFTKLVGKSNDKAALDFESFEIAQRAVSLSTGSALRQAAARLSKGDKTIDATVRERSSLYLRYRDTQKQLRQAIAANSNERAELLRKDEQQIDAKISQLTSHIQKTFPQFSKLQGFEPLSTSSVQGMLRADEALIFVVDNGNIVNIFALSREAFQAYEITNFADPVIGVSTPQEKSEQNKKRVVRFRKGLSPESIDSLEEFDLSFAHDVYLLLFGNLDPLFRVKKNWLIVPTGAFTALPFHLLVTDPPATRAHKDGFKAYREAEWIMRSHAITILPSVDSLQSLRALAGRSPASRALIGFADPFIREHPAVAPSAPAARRLTRSYSEFWVGDKVDRKRLQFGFEHLPEAAEELRAIALQLGVPAEDIFVGKRASETAVKKSRLQDFRIVYFATHGLVAGEVKGLAQPALLLSLHGKPTRLDDGLLTSSEITELSMNADWVVLSACNTVAGETADAEPLSGLARAFFHAGARALLVSHWAVDSVAAARLTTSTFQKLSGSSRPGRSEALRQSMIELLLDTSDPRNSHPAIWAPFMIVGEGGN